MKLLIATLLSTILISSTFASAENECYLILTNNYEYDSIHFYREAKESDRDYGRDFLGSSYFIIRDVLKDIGCKRQSINFGKGPNGKSRSKCNKVAPGINSSRVCYIESNLGYFYVTWNQLDNSNIVFNRWD
jgi:hypothetical protein